jgi:hypothetical protein
LQPDVTRNPALQLVWIFLDALVPLRQRKELADRNGSNGGPKVEATQARGGTL